MTKLTSLLLSISLLLPAACTDDVAPEPGPAATTAALTASVPIVVQSRTSTATSLVVNYTAGGQAHVLSVAGDATATTHVVRQGSRQLLRATVRRDGTGTLTDDLGRTITLSALRADPGLAARFDGLALATLDPHVFGFLARGSTTLNPCLAGIIGVAVCAIGAYIAACVEWEYFDGTFWAAGKCSDG